MKRKSLLFIPVIALLLGGCNNTPTDTNIYPVSITPSISELSLSTNTTYDLNELVSLSFNPSDTTNKEVVWSCETNEYFSISGTSITTNDIEGRGDIRVTSVSKSDVYASITVIVTAPVVEDVSAKYNISYDMGTRKTSYAFKDTEANLIKDTFVIEEDKDDVITSISSFHTIYGGGYGGKDDNAWVSGNMLKIGTTSANGDLTLNLSRPVNKISVTGMVSDVTCKLQVGNSEDETKLETVTCSSMAVASKEVVENKSFTTMDVEFESTSSLKIATSNKKVFYLTSIELFFGEEKTYTVRWLDEDETVLETDLNVKEGSVPTYDGEEPHKEGFTFNGWTPEVGKVYKDIDYKATYIEIGKTYTVTWVNYNDTVLEVDNNVPGGTTPTYNGETPKKESSEEYDYIFNGWNPSITPVKEDITYKATFISRSKSEQIPGINPVVSIDGQTIEYGFYPQSHVKDESLISELETLSPINNYNWVYYNGDYYLKSVASTYNSESYTFIDNTSVINGNEYWFKCETIKWSVLSINDNDYTLISNVLLDTCVYYKDFNERTINGSTIYPNNYKESDIRTHLNENFYQEAFYFNNSYVTDSLVSNSGSTTDKEDNIYACGETTDKVYLPSYQEVNNVSIRTCLTSDYARSRGSWANTKDSNYKYNGSYWTRSPSSSFSYASWNVNSGGHLSEYAISGTGHSIRPCVKIHIA